MTQRLCKICGKWHDLDEDWPQECYAHYRPSGQNSIQIIKDIEPYRPVASDLGKAPKPVMSRREHREFLKRNNYREVGNELNNAKPSPPPVQTVTGRDIKAAIEQLRSRK